jgi:hypothetical protein
MCADGKPSKGRTSKVRPLSLRFTHAHVCACQLSTAWRRMLRQANPMFCMHWGTIGVSTGRVLRGLVITQVYEPVDTPTQSAQTSIFYLRNSLLQFIGGIDGLMTIAKSLAWQRPTSADVCNLSHSFLLRVVPLCFHASNSAHLLTIDPPYSIMQSAIRCIMYQ